MTTMCVLPTTAPYNPPYYSSTYSGGGSNRSARISCITLRRFSTSARRPITSVGESELEPTAEPAPEPDPGDRGSLLDAEPAFEPTAEPNADDAAIDGA